MNTRSTTKKLSTPLSDPESLFRKKRSSTILNWFDNLSEEHPISNLFEAKSMADDLPMWAANRTVAPTPGAAIVVADLGENFTVKGHHLSMIKDRQFDGRSRADPHKHIAEFIEICGMFRYGDTNVDAIKLKLFPSSLSGDAKVWYNELTPGTINTWEEMRQAFVSRFFPPAMYDRLMGEIRAFSQNQNPNESLVEAWLRMKDLLRSCHGHNLGRGTIIQIFYHGLDEASQAILDAGGIFL
jgi:hypothetical protein